MTDLIGSRKNPTNDKRWPSGGRSNRGRNQWPSNASKQVNNTNSWDKSIAASLPQLRSEKSPTKQDSNAWEQPSGALDWGATPADTSTNQNPWATDPAPVDVDWGDMASCLTPAPQEEEWVYQDPNAPLELNSLNLAAYCSPVDDWNRIITNARQYHQLKRQERVTKWVMGGTEEPSPPNVRLNGVRPLWKPFSNRSPHALPGAYS
ncbi:hypothetical protein EV426DRAFT_599317 [Tirmania nivea]|nr:hypothetical protein EV426DRAFT_599317 [Tirmania nivea]